MIDRSLDMSERDESLESDKQELEQLSMTSKPAFDEVIAPIALLCNRYCTKISLIELPVIDLKIYLLFRYQKE